MARSRLFSFILTLGVVVGVWTGAPERATAQSRAQSDADTAPYTPAEIKAWDGDAARLSQLVSAYRARLSRDAFDIDALGESLNFEAQQIGRFVQSHIAYEAYPGLLRGALGTLTAGAGNALDQSVLMATLLNDAGLTARIASATVGPAVIERLAEALTLESPPSSKMPSDANSRALVFDAIAGIPRLKAAQIEQVVQIQSPPAVNELPEFASARSISAELSRSLGNDVLGQMASELTERQARDMATHYWVEYRELPSDPWSRVDPVLARVPLAEELIGPVSYLSNPVPATLLHRLRIQVNVLATVNAKPQRRLVAQWEVVAANQAQHPMTLQITSARIAGKGPDAVLEEGLATDIFVPVFNGKAAAKGFDTAGNVVPAAEAATAAGALFATTSAAMRRAEQALADPASVPDKDAPEAVIGFDAVELTYTLFSPGTKPRIEKRELLNIAELKTSPTSFVSQFYRQITRQHSLFVATGRQSDVWVVDRMLARQQARIELARAVVSGNRRAMARTFLQRDADLVWLYGDALLRLFDQMDQQRNIYRSAPTLLVFRRSLPVGDRVAEGTDIVFNERRLRLAAAEPAQMQALLELGVWESMIEGIFLERDEPVAAAASTTELTFTQIDGASLPAAANDRLRLHMSHDLAEGYRIAVADPFSAASPGGLRYWRIGPDGTVVAVGETGEGNETTEYTVQQQVMMRLMCSVSIYGMCSNVVSFAKPTAALLTIGTSAEEIQAVILAVNAILGAIGAPSLSIPEGVELGGALLMGSAGALTALEAIKRKLRAECKKFAVRKCFGGA